MRKRRSGIHEKVDVDDGDTTQGSNTGIEATEEEGNVAAVDDGPGGTLRRSSRKRDLTEVTQVEWDSTKVRRKTRVSMEEIMELGRVF
jgi:hypothetical protein